MVLMNAGRNGGRIRLIPLVMLLASPLVWAETPPSGDADAERAAYRERVQSVMRDAYLSQALDRSGDRVVMSKGADGTVMMDLQGGFQHAMLVRVNADGEIETQCHSDLESAAKFLAGGGEALTESTGSHSHED